LRRMPTGPINRHRGLGPDDLPRRYRRRHDRDDIDDDVHDDWQVDDYWDPRNDTSELELELHRVWQALLNLPFPPTGERAQAEPARQPVAISPADLAAAIREHLDRVLATGSISAPLDELREVIHRVPGLRTWFEARRGPALMLMVFAPFWIRPLSTWVPPAGADTPTSLIEHLLVRYPVPHPFWRSWQQAEAPVLKWATWFVLLAQGASLHRAAPRFGWFVTAGFVQHLLALPYKDIDLEIEPAEAVLLAEVLRLGGTVVEFDRIQRHPGFVLDPTRTSDPEQVLDEERPDLDLANPAADAYRQFWRSTIQWLAHNRDEIGNDACNVVLDWALHRHIEDRARDVPEHLRFSWSGRTAEAATRQAMDYQQNLDMSWPAMLLFWPARGWDRTYQEGANEWSVRELVTGKMLADESKAMHHCVASYVYNCARGTSAIFSVRWNEGRLFTVEIEPTTRRVVQARGVSNRTCTDGELAFVQRWLADTAAPKG
jgi:hypothetical protein